MATKTFSHAVIWNGEIVPANTPIEIAEETKSEEKKTVIKNDKGTSRKA